MKNKELKIILLALIFLWAFYPSKGQKKELTGYVTTFDSIPLIGATIKSLNADQTVLSDSVGNFSISCTERDKLKISARGFYMQKVKVTDQTKFVNVNLELKPGEKNREYAIGYGHVNDREKLYAVANLNDSDLDFSRYTDLYEVIRGRFTGVTVANNGEIIVRGVNSIHGSSAAMVVVNGSPVESSILGSIPPSQVKNINILKGGTAIYGARGANGVVIIETHKGGE